MIFRRLAQNLRDQNWTAIFIEFVLLVLGVFLGIQVANWNTELADRRTEAEYLGLLRGDLRNIQQEVTAQIEFERFQANLADKVHDLIRNDTSAERARKIAMGLNELTVRRTLRTQSPTFLDLQGSGRLEIISDPALRAAIIAYFYRTSRFEAVLDKNNVFFIDQAFVEFVLSRNIPPLEWDADLMHAPLPASIAFATEFKAMAFKSPLYANVAGALAASPEAPLWDDIVARVAWRGLIAINNEGLAQRLSAATQELEARIARRLEERTR